MEGAPPLPNFESLKFPEFKRDDDKEDDEKEERRGKRRSPSFESLQARKKQEAQQKTSEALDKMSLLGDTAPSRSKLEKLSGKMTALGERSRHTEQTAEKDQDVPLEALSQTEKQMAVKTMGGKRREELEQEQPQSKENSAEVREAEAARAFMQEIADQGDIDVAFWEIVRHYDVSPEEIAAELATADQTHEQGGEEAPGDAPEVESPAEPEEEIIDPRKATEGEIVLSPKAAETDDEDEPTPATVAGSGGARGTGSTGTGGAGGSAGTGGNVGSHAGAGAGGGGTGVPPTGGGGHGGNAGGPPYGPLGGGPTPFGAPGFNPNTYAAPAAASTSRTEYVPDYQESNAAGAALLGGIIGYFIGRRRGRIKTERRLLPIQKKLEKEVKGLAWQLSDRETKLRRLARERQLLQRDLVTAEGARAAIPQPRTEAAPRRGEATRVIPESRLNLEKPARLERLGHVLVAAEIPAQHRKERVEASQGVAAEQQRRAKERAAEMPSHLSQIQPEQVEMMNRKQLLELSEKIVVEGASLKEIFEAHLISEKGLRRMVSEYLKGKDVRRELKREMVEREIDFERDPILRDRARSSVSGGGNKALNNLLQKAGIAPGGDDDALSAAVQAQIKDEEERRVRAQQHRRVADITLASTILILLALVIMLFLTR